MAAKKGLGTGLNALFGEAERDAGEEIQMVPISRVEPRENQPRVNFDEASLQELADSLKEYGMIQPITARRLPSGYYQIIAGERRWRAARLAGLREVPVREIEADERLATELALVENLQREDLNPIEEALGYKTLIDEYGMTQDEASRRVGKSRPTVTNALRLLSLAPEVQQFVEQGLLSAGHARALVSVKPEEAQIEAARRVIASGLSVRSTEQLAAKLMREPKEEKPEGGIRVDYAAEVSKKLEKALGRKVQLTERGKRGKITLEYYNAEDRERLIDLLAGLQNK